LRRRLQQPLCSNNAEVLVSVVRINEFEALAGRRDELRTALHSILPTIRGALGCVSCQLLESEEDAQRFVILEVWTTREAHSEAAGKIPEDMLRRTMTLVADVPRGGYYLDPS
jgi:Antibiotic biosynthesis monooxygenase